MQLTIDIGYDQLFELVRQLPAWEKERFVREMAIPEQEVTLEESESRQDLIVLEERDGFRIVQVPFPDTEDGRRREKEQKQMQDKFRQRLLQENQSQEWQCSTIIPKLSREEIEQRRQEALRLALECPVATLEEIEAYNEFRSRFRCRQK